MTAYGYQTDTGWAHWLSNLPTESALVITGSVTERAAFDAGYRQAQLDAAAEIDRLAKTVWLTHSKTRAYHIALKHAAELLTAHAEGREPPNLPKDNR